MIGVGRGGKDVEFEVKGVALDAHRGKRARKGAAISPKVKPSGLR